MVSLVLRKLFFSVWHFFPSLVMPIAQKTASATVTANADKLAFKGA